MRLPFTLIALAITTLTVACLRGHRVGYYPLAVPPGNYLIVNPLPPAQPCPGSHATFHFRAGVRAPKSPSEAKVGFTLFPLPARDFFWLNPPAAVFPQLFNVTVASNTQIPYGAQIAFPAPSGSHELRIIAQIPCGTLVQKDQAIFLEPGQALSVTLSTDSVLLRVLPRLPRSPAKPPTPSNFRVNAPARTSPGLRSLP